MRSVARLLLLVGAAGLALPASAGRRAGAAGARPERVVLVVFGGGVRAKDVLRRADLCPTVRAIAAAGCGSDGWVAAGSDPTDGTKGILVGATIPVVTPGRIRPDRPTLLEYVRRGRGLPASKVWYASYADGEAVEVATSDHPSFGPAVGPSVAVGAGPFAEALRGLFRLFGRPNPTSERTFALLRGLRAATAAARGDAEPVPDADEELRVERSLLEEVDRRADIGGAAALDARAVRAGISLLRLHRPALVVIRLGQADVGSTDLVAYEDVLRRNDAELARLRAAIADDPALATTTALVVATDVGRDATADAAGRLGRRDGSLDATTCAIVAEGPGIRRGAVPKAPRDMRDLAPTLCALLGVPSPHAEGRVRDELLAR